MRRVLLAFGVVLAAVLSLRGDSPAADAVDQVLWGYVNADGKVVIPAIYERSDGFKEARARVRKNGKYGFLNKRGAVVVPPKYDKAESFCEDLAAVASGNRWGFIDPLGTVVVPLRFESARSFHRGCAAVKQEGMWGFIDKAGKFIVPPRFHQVLDFQREITAVRDDWKWGFIDRTGRMAISPQFDEVDRFSDGLAAVRAGSIRGFVDVTGKSAVPDSWTSLRSGGIGVMSVEFDDEYGQIDKRGQMDKTEPVLWESRFESIRPIRGGPAQLKDKWVYVDTHGLFAGEWRSDDVGECKDGRIVVGMEVSRGFVEQNGRVMSLPRWGIHSLWDREEGKLPIKQNGMWGFVDPSGEFVIDPHFAQANHFSEGLAAVGQVAANVQIPFAVVLETIRLRQAGCRDFRAQCGDEYEFLVVAMAKLSSGKRVPSGDMKRAVIDANGARYKPVGFGGPSHPASSEPFHMLGYSISGDVANANAAPALLVYFYVVPKGVKGWSLATGNGPRLPLKILPEPYGFGHLNISVLMCHGSVETEFPRARQNWDVAP